MMIKIHEMEVECNIIHRRVKNARIEIRDGSVRLILPTGTDNYGEILEKNVEWIYKKLSSYYQLEKVAETRILELNHNDEYLKRLVTNYITTKSQALQVKVNKISFRKMKSRWGSCSVHRNISINTRLKYLPPRLIKYVSYHELVHLVERKHDKNFWKIIREEYPDYRELENELKIYWLRVKGL